MKCLENWSLRNRLIASHVVVVLVTTCIIQVTDQMKSLEIISGMPSTIIGSNRGEDKKTSLLFDNNNNNTNNNNISVPDDNNSNNINSIDTSWCPHAKCDENHICRTCERRFMIVISTSRSASTTLTWMLDKLPNIRMSGENNDAIKKLKQTIDETFGFKFLAKNEPRGQGAWGHNEFPPGHSACLTQAAIELLNPPANVSDVPVGSYNNTWERINTILGFKTVRLHLGIQKFQLPRVAEFLQDSFPCARFVVNYRSNNTAQALSVEKTFHSKNKNITMSRVEDGNEMLKALAELLGKDRAYLLDSTLWTENVTILNEMVRWLGFNEYCYFSELLEYNTIGTGYTHGKTDLELDQKCRYSSADPLLP